MQKKIETQENLVEIRDNLSRFLPKDIVATLDQYIVGQDKAKRLVAVALRNRIRRKFVDPAMRDEISPKNLLLIGPTGVGKTEIARRMALTLDAPFIKIEATKFTERGYVGRDVESMIRSLVNTSVNLVKSRMRNQIKTEVEGDVKKILLKLISEEAAGKNRKLRRGEKPVQPDKNVLRKQLEKGELETMIVQVRIKKKLTPMLPMADMFPGIEDMDNPLGGMLGDMNLEAEDVKRMAVADARDVITQQYLDERIDKERAVELGLKWAQEMGIVFIDEIDKIADKSSGNGPEVSREGVQRDLLPIIEGTTVNTRYGMVKTDHILFIAAGAFHVTKPSDMIPELQGRFPIRVELQALTSSDLSRILTEPKNSIIRQYQALLATEGVTLEFQPEAIAKIVEVAAEINASVEDIGARRLHTIMEYLLEDISFDAPQNSGKTVSVTRELVEEKLSAIRKDRDLTRYIL